MEKVRFDCWKDGKKRALTMSYDDGVFQDRRLVEIFNKYNLKCTFNLNSDRLGMEGRLERPEYNVNHTNSNNCNISKYAKF